MGSKLNLKVRQGSMFKKVLRWETEPFIYKPITSIGSTAPCALHVPGHGLLQSQLFAIQNAQGLVDLNEKAEDITQWHRAHVVDDDHIEINRVNALAFKAHTPNTGVIKYRTVVDLTGYTARLTLRERMGGVILHTMTSADPEEITLDPATGLVSFVFSSEASKLWTWRKAVFELDLIDVTGEHEYTIATGDLHLERE